MGVLFKEGPVVACSSGKSTGAICLLRLSGFESLEKLQVFFSKNIKKMEPRRHILTDVLKGNQVLDRALVVFFPAPRSYTGENMLELSVHGNLLNVERILNIFIQSGFRHAEPGEFTYRAFKNKKMTLSQVEGLDLLIHANSSLAVDQGLQILHGELAVQYRKLHSLYLSLKASVELSIDFSEDVGETTIFNRQKECFEGFFSLIQSLHARVQNENSSLLHPSIVLLGEPNGGKSSLFNALVKDDRSIVSDSPGTTRDYISESISFLGINFRIIDTAGLRRGGTKEEKEGILKAEKVIREGFFKILLVNPFECQRLDELREIPMDLLAITHMDLPCAEDFLAKLKFPSSVKIVVLDPLGLGSIEPKNGEGGSIEPKSWTLKKDGSIEPSDFGKERECIEVVSDAMRIFELAEKKFRFLQKKNPLLVDRHCRLIKSIYSNFNNLYDLWKKNPDMGIISSELDNFSQDIMELIGVVSLDDVLDCIFSNFCIGK